MHPYDRDPNIALKDAILAYDVGRIANLLDKSPTLKERLNDPLPDYCFGSTPLIAAVHQTNHNMIDLLLRSGAQFSAALKSWRMPRWLPGPRRAGLRANRLWTGRWCGALAVACFLVGLCRAVPAVRDVRADPFFDPSNLQKIHLEIGREDLDRMQHTLPRRISVPGRFRWNDGTAWLVGIRYKGNSSSPPDWPFKRSFLISFGKLDPERRFLGLQHVALDNGIQFGGLVSERLITDALRGVGVKASRCNYARVYLNGKPAGVYVNVERIDRSFLARHFDSDLGPLFKVDEGGPGADLQFIGGDPAAYRKTFELHAGDPAEAFGALVEFVRVLNDPVTTATDLERHLDVESFLKTTAVMLLAGAFDQ